MDQAALPNTPLPALCIKDPAVQLLCDLLRLDDQPIHSPETLQQADWEMASGDGADWDTINLEINIPAGETSLTVQAFSRDDLGTGNLPASFSWLGAGLMMVELPPSIDVQKTADPIPPP